MVKLVLSVVACMLIVISGIVLHGLSAFELPDRAQQTLSFSLGDARLEGTLLLPENKQQRLAATIRDYRCHRARTCGLFTTLHAPNGDAALHVTLYARRF